MFVGFPALAKTHRLLEKDDPANVPPPTPITLPRYQPFAQNNTPVHVSLSDLLATTGRQQLAPSALAAIGLHLENDVDVRQLIPDPASIPDFASWDRMTLYQSQNANESTRLHLSNGNKSPGCQIYYERIKELSNANQDAFRAVRRLQPKLGKVQARLGSAYEFFRCLEQVSIYWDDPTKAASLPPSPEVSAQDSAPKSTEATSNSSAYDNSPLLGRTKAGNRMPSSLRYALISAFLKLVTYDFGCNVSLSKTEPRLHMRSPRDGRTAERKSYYSSRCQFIFQSPTTREAARSGFVYGPVAAVDCRADTNFTWPSLEAAQSMDLAREVISALITAQHRLRQGKTEEKFGHGKWWTTRPRWGGGPGGPIGREIQDDDISGDKDVPPEKGEEVSAPASAMRLTRRNLATYDNYRMVRPPAATWDRKTKYMPIGKQAGTNYDDIFLFSCLYHHVSILRVRVPLRLLEVLDGDPEPDPTCRSWSRVEAFRTPWYDLFYTSDRIQLLRLVWSVMAYQMRQNTGLGQQ